MCPRLKHFGIVVLLFVFGKTQAQLKDCNAFLKGAYVEVGINWNGAFGSSTSTPPNYHPKGSSSVQNSHACGDSCAISGSNLGFVCDPDKDGWTVGAPPYFGDYFLPGRPQEGWSIQVDSLRADAWNANGCVGPLINVDMEGSNISVTDSNGMWQAIWQGEFDSVQITQITTLDTMAVFFNVHIIFKNLSHHIIKNIYYMRTVDPDNDEAEAGGGFDTRNKIEYQQPNAQHTAMVSATGKSSSKAYLGLGTRDDFAKCFIVKYYLFPDTGVGTHGLDSMYGRYSGKGDTTAYQYSGSNTADQGIALVYKVGSLKASLTDSIVISYAYIFSPLPDDIDSALNSTLLPSRIDTTTHHTNTSTSNINRIAEDIKVFPNPFKDKITITGAAPGDRVTIYDHMGKLSQTFTIQNAQAANTFSINNTTGVYILQVTDRYGAVKMSTPLQKQ